MPREILVPLDGSAFAETVLPPVGLVAQATGSTVTLLHFILPAPPFRPLVGPLARVACGYSAWDADSAQPHADLDCAARFLASLGVVVQKRVLTGEPAEALPAYVLD